MPFTHIPDLGNDPENSTVLKLHKSVNKHGGIDLYTSLLSLVLDHDACIDRAKMYFLPREKQEKPNSKEHFDIDILPSLPFIVQTQINKIIPLLRQALNQENFEKFVIPIMLSSGSARWSIAKDKWNMRGKMGMSAYHTIEHLKTYFENNFIALLEAELEKDPKKNKDLLDLIRNEKTEVEVSINNYLIADSANGEDPGTQWNAAVYGQMDMQMHKLKLTQMRKCRTRSANPVIENLDTNNKVLQNIYAAMLANEKYPGLHTCQQYFDDEAEALTFTMNILRDTYAKHLSPNLLVQAYHHLRSESWLRAAKIDAWDFNGEMSPPTLAITEENFPQFFEEHIYWLTTKEYTEAKKAAKDFSKDFNDIKRDSSEKMDAKDEKAEDENSEESSGEFNSFSNSSSGSSSFFMPPGGPCKLWEASASDAPSQSPNQDTNAAGSEDEYKGAKTTTVHVV